MVRAFVAIGSLLVLVLLGALIAPFFVDWTAYRSDFEREASRILGRHVVVAGDASARLLPFPSVTFGDVQVTDDAGHVLMTVERFRMDAELAPYLSGEIRIFSMRLEEPRVSLAVSREGRVSWIFGEPNIPTGATVVLENVEISNGTVVVANARTGKTDTLTAVDAKLSARSLSGPMTGTGTLQMNGHPLDVSLSTGAPQPEAGLPVKARIDSPDLNTGFIVEGSADLVDGQPQLAGTLRVFSPLPPQIETTDDEPFASPSPAGETPPDQAPLMIAALPPIQADSKIEATLDQITLSEMRVEAGTAEAPYTLTGSGRLALGIEPGFALDLEGEQVDVDTLAADGDENPGALGFGDRVEAVRRVLASVPHPAMPGTIRMSLPVVVAGDTTIRAVAFTASPTDAGWSLKSLSAELPGRTRLEASGQVDLDDDFRFRGNLLVASRQPSGFSNWLSGSVDPAVRPLTRAGFSAKVDLSQDTQILDNLEVDIGGNVLTGRLERSGSGQARALATHLSGQALDLDAFLALSRIFTGKSNSLIDAERYDIALTAGPVTYQNAAARSIDAALSYDGSDLDIGKLQIAGLAGADLSASGRLTHLQEDPEGNLEVALHTDQPSGLLQFLQDRLPDSPALAVLRDRAPSFGPLNLNGRIGTVESTDTDRPALRLDIDGAAAGTEIKASVALENGFDAAVQNGRFGVQLRLVNDDPGVLLDQLGFETLPVEVPAPLSLEVSLSGEETGPAVVSAALRAPDSEITANGTLDLAIGGVTGLDVAMLAQSRDLAPWLLATGGFFGQSVDTLPVDLAGDLSWYKGDWTFDNLAGTVAGTALKAELRRAEGAPVTGQLHLSELSLPWLAQLVYGGPPLADEASATWSPTEFRMPLLLSSDVAVDVSADAASFGNGVTLDDLTARLTSSESELQLTDFAASLDGGTVGGTATLRNANGVGGFSLNGQLSGVDLSRLLSSGRLTGQLDATVALDGTGQSYAALVSSMTGAGEISLKDAAIAGIAEDMLPPVLVAADQEGFTVDQATVGDLVQSLSGGARFYLGDVQSKFAVTGGVARLAPIEIAHETESLTLDGSLDLSDGALAGNLQLALDPGDEAIEGADPIVAYNLTGSLSEPEFVTDVRPLAGFLSVRALEREQARVEAMQESLQEKLRLRREVRFYRWREAERGRLRAEAAAAEAERRNLERQRAADERRAKEEADRRQTVQDDAIRRAIEAARQADEIGNPVPPRPEQAPDAGQSLDFDNTPESAITPSPNLTYPSLPGVSNPKNF
ncbi:AsmA family protein [Consotaella aegiceratis]|uniref:AsmA family protein n=1 Tax=Consotaella aegiceratis TaxID=3097961 RepID=UPI002F422937